jgi:hypothetical protein
VKLMLPALGVGLLVLLAPGSPAESQGFATKRAVAKIEILQVLAQPGIKVRLTMEGGEAIDYKLDRAVDAETHLRLLQTYLEGSAQMWAEIDGRRNVVAVSVEGPTGRFGGAR